MLKINWRKGAGEFIGYAVSMVILLVLFNTILKFTLYGYTRTALSEDVTAMVRDLATCETLDEAQALADKWAAFIKYDTYFADEVTANVDLHYSCDEWQKGSYAIGTVQIQMTGDILLGNRVVLSSSELFMIERFPGDDDNGEVSL